MEANSRYSGFHPPPGWPKTLSLFFACLFVTLLNVTVVCPISPWRRWSTETILLPLDRGRFVVVHPCSTFWDWWPVATSLNAEVQKTTKTAKIVFFSPPQDDRINRSRRNLARNRRPWVCYSTPNLALIGKRGSVQKPTKMPKFAQNCGFWPPETDTMNTFRWNLALSLIHIWRCRRSYACRSRWSPYH